MNYLKIQKKIQKSLEIYPSKNKIEKKGMEKGAESRNQRPAK